MPSRGITLASGYSARASSEWYEVTPAYSRAVNFRFDIKGKPVSADQVEFRVVVTGGKEDFADPDVSLSMVKFTDSSEEIDGVSSIKPVKTDTTVTCTFTVPKKSIDDPNFCFLLTNPVGEWYRMPAVEYYYARLKDFVVK